MASTLETSTQFHFPGQKYTGPGTHIVSNILNKVKPSNRTDAVTLKHDIDYMLATNRHEAFAADYRAVMQADNDLPGIATKIGLTGRSLFLPTFFYGGDVEKGKQLKQIVKTDPYWRKVFNEYQVDLENW